MWSETLNIEKRANKLDSIMMHKFSGNSSVKSNNIL